MARGDGLKAVHDAPHRAEQADKGRRRADGGEIAEAALDPVGLAQDGDAHRLFDAVLDAGEQRLARRAAFEGAPPFAQRGDEHRGERDDRALGECCA